MRFKEDKMKTKTQKETINVMELNLQTRHIKVRGITPLLLCAMDMFAVQQIDNKKNGKAVSKDTRTEEQKFDDRILKNDKGQPCLPAETFYKGMIFVAPYLDGLDMKKVRGSIRIMQPMIPILTKSKIKVHETWGRQSGMTKAPLVIKRPMIEEWTCEFDIKFNASNISWEQIANLINWAGFQSGAGSWRAEKGGNYGQYELVTKE
jgi:hypothetical protein